MLPTTRILLASTICAFVMMAGGCSQITSRRDARVLNFPAQSIPDIGVLADHGLAGFDGSEIIRNDVADYSNVQPSKTVLRRLSLQGAIETALQNSNIVRVSDGGTIDVSQNTFYDVQAKRAEVLEELAGFDPNLSASIMGRNENSPPNAFFGPGLEQPLKRDEISYGIGLDQKFISGGRGEISYNPDPGYLFIPDSGSSGFNPRHVSEFTIELEQPLLRGAGLPVNIAPITIREIEHDQSSWEFKKSLLASVRSTVDAYWDLYAAQRKLKATEKVLPLLEEVVRIQKAAFEAKWVIAADVAKAEAEFYGYRQEYVAAQSSVATAELRLRNVMGLAPDAAVNLELVTQPIVSRLQIAPEMILDQALANNPELAKQRLEFAIRKLDLFIAQNQLKPQFDLSAIYRMNGVGEKLHDAFKQLATADFIDWEVGATFSVPIGRRQANAQTVAAENRMFRDQQILQQSALTLAHQLSDDLRKLEFVFRELAEVNRQEQSAEVWVKGARLRYQNPNPDVESATGLLEVLNDYLRAIRFQTDAEIAKAKLTAQYNSAVVGLEESKGTLLDFFAVYFPGDPCLQLPQLPVNTKPELHQWQLPMELSEPIISLDSKFEPAIQLNTNSAATDNSFQPNSPRVVPTSDRSVPDNSLESLPQIQQAGERYDLGAAERYKLDEAESICQTTQQCDFMTPVTAEPLAKQDSTTQTDATAPDITAKPDATGQDPTAKPDATEQPPILTKPKFESPRNYPREFPNFYSQNSERSNRTPRL